MILIQAYLVKILVNFVSLCSIFSGKEAASAHATATIGLALA